MKRSRKNTMATNIDQGLNQLDKHSVNGFAVDHPAFVGISGGKKNSTLLIAQLDSLSTQETNIKNSSPVSDRLSSAFLSPFINQDFRSSTPASRKSRNDASTLDCLHTLDSLSLDPAVEEDSSRDDFESTRVESEASRTRQEVPPRGFTFLPVAALQNQKTSHSWNYEEDNSKVLTTSHLCVVRDSVRAASWKNTAPAPVDYFESELLQSSLDSSPEGLPVDIVRLRVDDLCALVKSDSEGDTAKTRPLRRSVLILKPPRPTSCSVQTMASVMTSKPPRKQLFRPRLSLSRQRSTRAGEDDTSIASNSRLATSGNSTVSNQPSSQDVLTRRANSADDVDPLEGANTSTRTLSRRASTSDVTAKSDVPPRRGVLERLRSVSRSRSVSRNTRVDGAENEKPILVAVTSCRSDAYYNQKAPGSTSKLPRKAPSNLKLFHELAIGIKDAYLAVGKTPKNPNDEESEGGNERSAAEKEGRRVLWEFIGHLDFVSRHKFVFTVLIDRYKCVLTFCSLLLLLSCSVW